MECTGQGNDFELIPTVKIETRNPEDGYFGSDFLAICNHCRVKSQGIKMFEKFLRFLEKRPLTVNFFNFCSESFHSDTDDLLCSNFMNFGRREINELMRCLSAKNFV